MPGRNYSSNTYRYGFNGKENDNEVKNITGSQQDYGMRIYDPRLGKFLSVDPLAKSYSMLTPYQFSSNNPILLIDIDGKEGALPPINTGVLLVGRYTCKFLEGLGRGTVSLAMGIGNSASTFATGIYNAATVYVPQTFGYRRGATGAKVLTTEGFKEFGGPEHTSIQYNSSGAVGDALVSIIGSEVATPIIGAGVGALGEAAPYLKFGGFGGDIVANSSKTTTVIGRYFGGTEEIITSGKFRVGQNTGGLNLLSVETKLNTKIAAEADEFWSTYNKPWLDDAISRKDVFRLVSDPSNPEKIFINSKDASEGFTMFGREVNYLTEKGYTFEGANAIKPKQ